MEFAARSNNWAQRAHIRKEVFRTRFLATALSPVLRWLGAPKATEEKRTWLIESVRDVLEQDLKEFQSGLFPQSVFDMGKKVDPANHVQLLLDFPRILKRAKRGVFDDLPREILSDQYPNYYLRNFHYQTDGYLSARSAAIYDIQVELLFGGLADVMRRRMLSPIVEYLRDLQPSQEPVRIVDVATGTGRLAQMINQTCTTHFSFATEIHGIDLSPFYIRHAQQQQNIQRHQNPHPQVHFCIGNAEMLPYPDNHFDVVTCIYLFHELPPKVRRTVMKEMSRVLKPGGRLVFGDSTQIADAPEIETELRMFAQLFHEPYYLSYIGKPLAPLFEQAGLEIQTQSRHHFTKIVTAKKLQTME